MSEKTTVANGMGLTGDANERGWKMRWRWRWRLEMEEEEEEVEEVVEEEAVCLWHLGEELRDLGAPQANPVIHLARISQKQPNIFSSTAQQDLLFTAQKCLKIRLGVCRG